MPLKFVDSNYDAHIDSHQNVVVGKTSDSSDFGWHLLQFWLHRSWKIQNSELEMELELERISALIPKLRLRQFSSDISNSVTIYFMLYTKREKKVKDYMSYK